MEEIHSSAEFVGRVAAWIREGGAIVPFFGAGVSVSAGIPAIAGIKEYIDDCVVRSVADLLPDPKFKDDSWNPHHHPWPPVAATPAERALRKERLEALHKWDSGTAAAKPALLAAAGATADWRSGLQFLSRLERLRTAPPVDQQRGEHDPFTAKTRIGIPKQWIIDSFIRHIVADRNPSLEHRMLALLGDLLRVQISITTNFDDLYERACNDLGQPRTVFDVHLMAGMPPGNVVHNADRVLIKAHGGRYGYRADYSLDDEPSSDDRRHFTSYLAGIPLESQEWETLHLPHHGKGGTREPVEFFNNTMLPRALLVAGMGCNDQRTLRLMESAMSVLRKRVRAPEQKIPVFWVAYTRSDIDKLKSIGDQYPALYDSLCVIHEHYFGLMLLELYQQLTATVPSSPAEAPSMWRMVTPPERYEYADPGNRVGRDASRAADDILTAVNAVATGERRDRVLVVASQADQRTQVSDLVGAVSFAYERALDNFHECIWIELDEVANADELMERILEAMAKRVGDTRQVVNRATDHPFVDGGPLYSGGEDQARVKTRLQNQKEDRLRELERVASRSGHLWCIFLHGADGVANSLDYDPDAHFDSSEGPYPYPKSKWTESDYAEFKELVRQLTEAASDQRANLIVILTVEEKDSREMLLAQFGQERSIPIKEYHRLDEVISNGWPGLKRTTVPARPKLDNKDPNEQLFARFAYLHTSAEATRYPSGLMLWAVRTADDTRRFALNQPAANDSNSSHGWLDHGILLAERLRALGWMRRKSGGFLWMQPMIKAEIRNWLKSEFERLERESYADGTDVRQTHPPFATFTVDVEQSYADWYWKLFVSSKTPSLLFESIRHRLRCAYLALKHEDTRKRLLSAPIEVATSLALGEDVLLSTGYTPGSCDRLERIIEAMEFLATKDVPEPVQNSAKSARRQASLCLVKLSLEVVDARKIILRLKNYERNKPSKLNHAKDESIDIELKNILAQIKMRRFAEGARLIHDLASDVRRAELKRVAKQLYPYTERACDEEDKLKSSSVSVRFARDLAGEVGDGLNSNSNRVKELLRVCRQAMFLDVHRAEERRVAFHYLPGDAHSRPTTDLEKPILRRAVMIYHFSSELIRFLPPELKADSALERILHKTLFGSALSSLGEHTEAEQRFSEALALSGFGGFSPPKRSQLEGIIGILRAEARLREIYHRNEAFGKVNDHLKMSWRFEPVPQPPPRLDTHDRDVILAWIRDIDNILDVVRQKSMGVRKDAWWGTRYYYARMRSEVFRCIAVAATGWHDGILESRGEGLPSGIVRIANLLKDISRTVRTDVFMLSRCCHQTAAALDALKRWYEHVVPVQWKGRYEAQTKQCSEALKDAAATLQHIKDDVVRQLVSGWTCNPDDLILAYADWVLYRVSR